MKGRYLYTTSSIKGGGESEFLEAVGVPFPFRSPYIGLKNSPLQPTSTPYGPHTLQHGAISLYGVRLQVLLPSSSVSYSPYLMVVPDPARATCHLPPACHRSFTPSFTIPASHRSLQEGAASHRSLQDHRSRRSRYRHRPLKAIRANSNTIVYDFHTLLAMCDIIAHPTFPKV